MSDKFSYIELSHQIMLLLANNNFGRGVNEPNVLANFLGQARSIPSSGELDSKLELAKPSKGKLGYYVDKRMNILELLLMLL